MTGRRELERRYSKECSSRKSQHVQCFTDDSDHGLHFEKLRGHCGFSEGHKKSRRNRSQNVRQRPMTKGLAGRQKESGLYCKGDRKPPKSLKSDILRIGLKLCI